MRRRVWDIMYIPVPPLCKLPSRRAFVGTNPENAANFFGRVAREELLRLSAADFPQERISIPLFNDSACGCSYGAGARQISPRGAFRAHLDEP
jgi:hypothetical protein